MKNIRKFIYGLSCCMVLSLLVACGSGAQKSSGATNDEVDATESAVPAYEVLDNPQVDLSQFETDADGYIAIFNGKDFTGWRGYGKENVPGKWTIEDGAIKFNGSGGGEAQDGDGGDIIFAHKFQNFELTFEWKVDKGSNSGVFYLAQEVQAKDPNTGEMRLEPIDRKSTRLNSSHVRISYAVFCLKKKN